MSDSSTLASRNAGTPPTHRSGNDGSSSQVDLEKPAANHNVSALQAEEDLVHNINDEKRAQAAAVEAGADADIVYPSGLKLGLITIGMPIYIVVKSN